IVVGSGILLWRSAQIELGELRRLLIESRAVKLVRAGREKSCPPSLTARTAPEALRELCGRIGADAGAIWLDRSRELITHGVQGRRFERLFQPFLLAVRREHGYGWIEGPNDRAWLGDFATIGFRRSLCLPLEGSRAHGVLWLGFRGARHARRSTVEE